MRLKLVSGGCRAIGGYSFRCLLVVPGNYYSIIPGNNELLRLIVSCQSRIADRRILYKQSPANNPSMPHHTIPITISNKVFIFSFLFPATFHVLSATVPGHSTFHFPLASMRFFNLFPVLLQFRVPGPFPYPISQGNNSLSGFLLHLPSFQPPPYSSLYQSLFFFLR